MRSKPAGVRTHVLISLGSCLFMVISEAVATASRASGFPTPDPARIAAQVVTGIGFLGAGALIQNNYAIKGLTSAATIWCMAAIGLACGTGLYATALSASIAIVLLLILFEVLEKHFGNRRKRPMSLQINLRKSAKAKQIREIRKLLYDHQIPVMNETVSRLLNELLYITNIKINRSQEESLLQELQQNSAIVDIMILKQSDTREI
ncbi:MAG: MgtC/SapB family protein [Leptospiraceae bacterium]|nr:MgtC/SapB family protein [Leptospiraceae bacterium]